MDFIVENNIIKSKDLTFDENVGGIGTVLFKHLKKYGTRIAQIEADSGKFDTFASLLEKCIRTAIALKQRGIRKEDFVCLSSDHHLNACVPIVAATLLGAVPFSLEPSLSIPDRSELLKQIQPKILFLRKSCEASFKESCKLAEVLVDTVIFEDSFEEEFLSPKSTEEEFNPVHIKDLKETAIIYFSSGTAGLPKPVCLNHYSLIARYSDIADGKISFITGKKSENGVMLSFSNWHWISSGWVLVCCTVDGVCRLLSNHFDPLEVWHYIHQYKVDAATGNTDTYSSLFKKCVRTAISLQEIGIGKSDIICLCSDLRINSCVPILAALFIGAIPFSLEIALEFADCVQRFTQIQPKIVFTIKEHCHVIKEALNKNNIPANLIVFEEDFENNFLSEKPGEEGFTPFHEENLNATAFISFSSESTGLPKPACVKHYQILSTCGLFFDEERCFYEKNLTYCSVYLAYSNWYWISSMYNLFINIVRKIKMVFCNEFNADKFWYYINNFKVTAVFLTPLKIIRLCCSKIPENINVTCLDTILYGGNTISVGYIVKLREIFPNTIVVQAYGQTEAGFLSGYGNLRSKFELDLIIKKPLSIGLPLNGLWYRVVDLATGRAVGFNQPGELQVKGKQIFNGYYNINPLVCFEIDGWYKTGDIVYYDEDFSFYFVERLTDVIKCRNWHVYPTEVENILMQHPAVQGALVIGKPDEVEGYLPMGLVVLKKDHDTITEEEIIQFVASRVNKRHRLKGGIKFVEFIPVTPNGKISRKLAKEKFLDKGVHW